MQVCVVAFAAKDAATTYTLADVLESEHGWGTASCQDPPCVHFAVTLPSAKNAQKSAEQHRGAIGAGLSSLSHSR